MLFLILSLCLPLFHAQNCGNTGIEWDYIIIGAGPGGSAAAAYLHTLDPANTNVLLLERGMDRNKELDDLPFMDTYLGGAQSFWPAGEHTSYANVNANGGTAWEQVKTLGGNQAANAGMYSAGDNLEFAGIFNVGETLVENIKAWVASYIKPRFAAAHELLRTHASNLGLPFRASDECSVTSTLYGTGVKPFIGRCEKPTEGCVHQYRWFDPDLGEGLRRTSFYKAYFYDNGVEADRLYQNHKKKTTTGNFLIKTQVEVRSLKFTRKTNTVSTVKADVDDFCLAPGGKVILAAGAFETAAILLRSGVTAQGGAGTNFHEHGAIIISDPAFSAIYGAVADLNSSGETACPIVEGELLFNGGGNKEARKFVGSQRFEFIYFVDCNNCLQTLYAAWFQNDKRGTITIDANGDPVVDYGWDYSMTDRQEMWEALEYFEANSGIDFTCNAATQQSFNDHITLLKTGTDAEVANAIIKFWHASGACSAGICFDDQTGVVFDTDNVYIGDVSSFPFPVSAHLSVASNVAGTIAAYKASGADQIKQFNKHEMNGMTCADLSNGFIDSTEERELRCSKFGDKSAKATKKACKNAMGKVTDTLFTVGQAIQISKGVMTEKAGIIECENGMYYHLDDICDKNGAPPKMVTLTCTCPDAIEKSSAFVPFKNTAGSCPTCAAPVAPTLVSKTDVAQHTDVDYDCWVVIWPHCPSQSDLCAGRSAGDASSVVTGCTDQDYYIVDISQDRWAHPGGKPAIQYRCGNYIWAWTTFGMGADGSGHAPSLASGAMPALQVPNTKLFNIFEGCP